MNARTTAVLFLFLSVIPARAMVIPTVPYKLNVQEDAGLRHLLTEAGYSQAPNVIQARQSENGEVNIQVDLAPISRGKHKLVTRLDVGYVNGQMKIWHTGNLACHDSADYYFVVNEDANDDVIDRAVEVYLWIMKTRRFDFLALGKIRSLHASGDSYFLEIEILGNDRYAFDLTIEEHRPNPPTFRKIEIRELPSF